MSDKQSRAGSPAPCVDAVADDLERVDVEAGIRLVEDGQAGIEQPHLKDFVTLFFTTRETDIDRA